MAGGNNRVAGESKQRLGFVSCGEEEEAVKEGNEGTGNHDSCAQFYFSIKFFFIVNVEPPRDQFHPPQK